MQNMGWNRGMPSNMLKEFKQSLKSSFKTKKTYLMNTADNEIMNKIYQSIKKMKFRKN